MTEDRDSTARRVDVLRAYGILDTPREPEFDELAALAAQVCGCPLALVSLVDAERQWFKAAVGTEARQTTLDRSICIHTLVSDGFLEIEDTRCDPRTAANPAVTGEPRIRFYAGAALNSPEGVAFGTLCVADMVPRRLTGAQRSALAVLARQVTKELDLRFAARRHAFLQREVDHRVKNSLQSVASFVRLQASAARGAEARDGLATVGRRIAAVALLHQELYSSAVGESIALDSYMGKLAGLFCAAAPEGVAVELAFAPAQVTSQQATGLATIVNEMVTNAFKYAFPDGRRGTVLVLGRTEGGTVTVTMRDDGVGLAPGVRACGLGVRIIEACAQQMDAALAFDTGGPGFGLTLSFPAVRTPAAPALPALQAVPVLGVSRPPAAPANDAPLALHARRA